MSELRTFRTFALKASTVTIGPERMFEQFAAND
jgi:hypothetical protein